MNKMRDAPPEHRYIWHAVVKRFAFASLIYVILWLTVSLTDFIPDVTPEINILLWLIFIATPLARFSLLHKFDACYGRLSWPTWHILFTTLSVAPVIAWTSVAMLSMIQHSSLEANLAIIFALVGLVSGGVNTFAPVMYQVCIFIFIMVLPPAYAITYFDTGFPRVIAVYFLLYGVGMLVVGKVQNAELKASINNSVILEKASYLDPLTGLANRRHLYKLIDSIKEFSQQYASAVVVAVDIDRFKSINDRYGHTAGDECLVRFARLFRSIFKDSGAHCIRMGGEEFIALFFDTNITEVIHKTDKLVETTRSSHFDLAEGSIHFTISGGIAHSAINKKLDLESLINKADSFLYLAKRNGRDRVEYSV